MKNKLIILALSLCLTSLGDQAQSAGVYTPAPQEKFSTPNSLAELAIVDVAEKGVVEERYAAEGRRYSVNYTISVPVLIGRTSGCTFFVGQQLYQEPDNQMRTYAAIGFNNSKPATTKAVRVKAMGALNVLNPSCRTAKPKPIESQISVVLKQTNPTQKILKQILVFNSHYKPERYLLSVHTQTSTVKITKISR